MSWIGTAGTIAETHEVVTGKIFIASSDLACSTSLVQLPYAAASVRIRGGGCVGSKSEAIYPSNDEAVDVSHKSKWEEVGASSLKQALHNTDMIDAAWLADLAAEKGVVPRFQDLPSTAKVSLVEMEAWAKG